MKALAGLALLFPSVAFATTVIISSPSQGETVTGPQVEVRLAVSEDFVLGKDGLVQMWLDGKPVATWSKASGNLPITPGAHDLQARLVTVRGQPLRVPTNSEQVRVDVPEPDPR